MIVQRTLHDVVHNAAQSFPVILVTGARQIGKTTLLQSCTDKYAYVTLDDLDLRELATRDPALFLQRYKPPLIIDEVQYAPELFSYIKIVVDREKKAGMFWLTGSQKFHLMKNVTESLAGRVAIIDMLGFSQAEINNQADQSQPFLPSVAWIEYARAHAVKKDLMEVYQHIWRGSFPRLWQQNGDNQTLSASAMDRDMFYSAYVQTYLQRDVQDLTQVGDILSFNKFLKAVAARTSQLLNYADIARDVGIDQKTAKSWLSILEASGIVYLLPPYYNNITKRLIKTPKVYMLDTGLCAYLTNWTSPETLELGAMSGAILETYMLSEILKSYWHNGKQAPFYFYRDADQREVDLLIEQNNQLYPVEFKKTATPSRTASKHFSVLKNLDKKVAEGAVICLKESDGLLSESVSYIPVSYL
ncbi:MULTISPECIES: ATP-binding protein [Cysteiniphilum]|uniref:ATP-binding protein n=1 Tax=Cysteiniphilum TaxID=2056696 RepID=UPI00177A8F15|nr:MULTISPECIES: ATP-binding protein [Cysteiniphilum]